MLALSPLFSSSLGWNLEDPTPLQLEQCRFLYSDECCPQMNDHCVNVDAGDLSHRCDDAAVIAPSLVPTQQPAQFPAEAGNTGNHSVQQQSSQQLFSNSGGDEEENTSAVVKKLNHNASERDRRRKINGLYSSLRSLLPPSPHSKKLSIPTLVSRAVKYIPELQREVKELTRRKDELLVRRNHSTAPTKTTGNSTSTLQQGNGKNSFGLTQQRSTSLCSIQGTQISSTELTIQISTVKLMDHTIIPFSEVLREIEEEEDWLFVVGVSHFESFGGRVFYNIHLQVQGGRLIKCEVLNEKLLSCYQRWETLCLWMT